MAPLMAILLNESLRTALQVLQKSTDGILQEIPKRREETQMLKPAVGLPYFQGGLCLVSGNRCIHHAIMHEFLIQDICRQAWFQQSQPTIEIDRKRNSLNSSH